MNKTEIINGNMLISEFMCIKNNDGSIYTNIEGNFPKGTMHFNWGKCPITCLYPEGHKWFDEFYGRWNDEWDFLMSAVEKIESLGFGFHKNPFNLRIIDYTTGDEQMIVCFEKDDNIDLITWYYLAVVDFVKWFNKNRKSN